MKNKEALTMNDYQVFWYIFGAIFGVLCSIAYLLWRISRILTKIAGGEPSNEDLRNIEFQKIRFK